MASNLSAQTRGLSAADWTRLQRLRGARSYLVNAQSNKDINPPTIPQTPYNPSLLIPRHTGVSRIQRPTSDWISYVGSQTADYILQTDTGLNGKTLSSTRLCNCTTSSVSVKNTGCQKCSVYVHKTMN
jgi:hypothetical protein